MNRFFKKVLVYLSVVAIVVQSLSPLAYLSLNSKAYAQVATPTPTIDQSVTPTPTDTPVPTPTDTLTPTPTVAPTPTDIVTPTVTPTPTDIVTPTPTPVDNLSPPVTNSQTPTDTSAQVQGDSTSVIPPPTPTVSPTPTQDPKTGNEQLNLIVLNNVSAPAIDLGATAQAGSAVLTTDKPDYAPTDTALITGSNLLPNTTYTLRVWSDDQPPTGVSAQVTSDANGVFAYAYQLDGTYRPNYKAELRDSAGVVVATVTFTDSGEIDYNVFEGEIAPQGSNNWTTGNISGYKEGDTINFRILWTSDGAANGHFKVDFTSKTSCRFFAFTNPTNLAIDYNTSTDVIDSGSGVTVSLSSLTQSGDDARADFNVSFNSAKTVRFNFTLTLADGAAGCASGSSQHVEVGDTSGDFKDGGKKSLPIPSSAVVPVTDITVSKTGTVNASIGGAVAYTVTVNNLDTTPASSVVVTDTLPAGITGTTATYDVDPNSSGGTGNCTLASQVFTCNIGTLGGSDGNTTGAEPDVAVITVNGTVNNNTQLCSTSLTNNVSVSTTTLESNTQNNSASASTSINACQGTLTVIKHVVSGTATASDWTMHIKQSNVDVVTPFVGAESPGTINNLNNGTYNVSETGGLSGYTPSYSGCDSQGNVTVTAGQPATCTIINTRDTGTIQVKKIVDPADNSQWDFTISGPTDNSTTLSNNGASSVYTSDTGSYTISEAGHSPTNTSDYTSAYNCVDQSQNVVASGSTTSASFTLATDKNVICTFTNTVKKGSVVVTKYHDHDANGTKDGNGDEVLSGWTINLSGNGSQPTNGSGVATFSDVLPNTYTLSETFPDSTWFQSNITCDNGRYDSTNKTFSVTVNPGTTVNCSIGNYQNGHVKVVKDVVKPNGDPLSDQSGDVFGFSVDGGNSFNLSDGQNNTVDVVPGPSHTVIETPNQSYDFDKCVSDPVSGLNGVTNGIAVPVSSGQTVTVTCTNKQKTATITVVKDVTKSDGSVVDDNHTFNVTVDGIEKPFGEGANAVFTVNPGTYSAVEGKDGSYTLVSNDGPKTVGSNSSATINIVNKQNPGTISGYKLNAAGTAGILGWAINLYSCTALGVGCTTFVANTTTAANGFFSFTNLITGFYQVLEDLTNPNYTPVSVTSHNATIAPGSASTGNNFANFKNINITVCKEADADGNIQTENDRSPVSGWGMTLSTNGQPGSLVRTGENGCYTFTNLGPANNYSVTEENRSGWTALSDPNFTFDFGTPQDGVNQSHTFVNVQHSTIIVKKVMVGGTDIFNFTGDVAGPINVNNGTLEKDVLPGAYISTEGATAGWDLTDISCDKDGSSGDINTRTATFAVSAGQTITCTFTNTKRGHIIVDKVTNPSADPQSFDFVLSSSIIDGFDLTHHFSLTDLATPYDSGAILPSGGYNVIETVPTGWDQTGGVCTVDGQEGTVGTWNQELHRITGISLGAGQTVRCTFTNTKRGTVIVTKFLDDNADGTQSGVSEVGLPGWEINLTGSDSQTTPSNGEVTFTNVTPGTHTLGETTQGGWNLSNIYCTNEISLDRALSKSNDISNEHNVNVSAGETVNCYVGNYQNAHITVVKDVVKANGDPLEDTSDDEFDFEINNQNTSSFVDEFSLTDGVPSGFNHQTPVAPGTYDVTEFLNENYDFGGCTAKYEGQSVGQTITQGEQVTVNSNDTVTVTCKNKQKPATLTIKKDAQPDASQLFNFTTDSDSGTVLSDFSLKDDGDSSNSKLFDELNGGTYTITEGSVEGWDLTNINCGDNVSYGVNGNKAIVAIDPGDNVTCTFTNTKRGKIIVTKYNDPEGEGIFNPDGQVLSGWKINLSGQDSQTTGSNGEVIFDNLVPGEFILGEDIKTGWKQTDISCPGVETSRQEDPKNLGVWVGAGQTVNCRILNHNLTPILTIAKTNDASGNKAPGDTVGFTLTITADIEGGPADNVTVTDLLPSGFHYNHGSWNASSSTHGALSLSEPTYASPGVWTVGHMDSGEVITLKYTANIDGSQQAGTYYDNAWAQGTAVGNSTVLLASADPDPADGNIGDPNFVGTKVSIVNNSQSGSYNTTVKKEVLGAETFLPATGEPTVWVIIATLLSGLGLGSLLLGIRLRRKYAK